jgi:hypothetical protein
MIPIPIRWSRALPHCRYSHRDIGNILEFFTKNVELPRSATVEISANTGIPESTLRKWHLIRSTEVKVHTFLWLETAPRHDPSPK